MRFFLVTWWNSSGLHHGGPCVDIFIGVYTRYVMGEATYWHEEVARYLFIWMVSWATVAVRRRTHVVHLMSIDLAGENTSPYLLRLLVMGFPSFFHPGA
jgi:TRAP-type C4-dicarboxylate transport system permease small subunit